MRDIIPTNYMITKVARKFGTTSKQAIKMRLLVLSYKTNHSHTYEDCLKYYEKCMKKG